MSIVDPAASDVPAPERRDLVEERIVPGASGKFSGEVDGFVTSQPVFRMGHEKVEEELGRPFHHRIGLRRNSRSPVKR